MSPKRKKIILVEDDSAIVDIYQTVMKKEHWEVQIFKSGGEAIEKIKELQTGQKEKPDVILLDLILPDIDGSEVFKTIKENNITKDIKVFILTNKENIGLKNFGQLKPDEFLIKANITPTQLVEIIKKHLPR